MGREAAALRGESRLIHTELPVHGAAARTGPQFVAGRNPEQFTPLSFLAFDLFG